RLGGHDHQQRELLRPRVADRVLVARGRAREVARAHLPLVVAHADAPPAREDVVELVADGVTVSCLLLARLEAVGVAEEVRRVDQADLLHLLGRERQQRGHVAKAVHRASYLERASSAARRSAARATRASASARVAARAVRRTRRSQSGAKTVARDWRCTPGT